ncbi:SUKH-4 family immunity protein [Streptomyces sp. NPDC004562]|uniref:SUKH-4 family immunity protein n=1 Tax=unclassified Streptomyces TaxID=2593676 RepID=UPI00369D1301
MPEINDDDWARIEAWRELSTRDRRVFSVLGPAQSGKSAYLLAVRDRWPSATVIDCRGLSADTVATRLREECGAAPADRPCILLLANVQYAGEVLTSTEPTRVAEILAPRFRRFKGREVWVMAEYDLDLVAPPRNAEYEVTLPASTMVTVSAEAEAATASRLGALAAAELRQVPLPVWQLLCSASGAPAEVPTLLHLAEVRPDLLVLDKDHSTVAFRSEALLHAWRRRQPWDAATQFRAVEALVSAATDDKLGPWSEQGPLRRYAAQALPLHAALAGALPQLLDDGGLLAHFSVGALREALAHAHPAGVPYGSVAAMLHYLEVQGVSPSSQGEWVAWLHHAALSSGHTELADGLLTAGVPLPWRTTWTQWRPSGIFGRIEGDAGRVDELGVLAGESGPTVVTARDVTTGKIAHPKYMYLRQEWSPTTGDPVAAPVEVHASLSDDHRPWSSPRRSEGHEVPDVAFAEHTDDGWKLETHTVPRPPTCPEAVTKGLYVDGHWVVAGAAGLFAVSVEPSARTTQETTYPKRPLIAPHTRPAPWPLPPSAAAALRGEDMRGWLEETFGAGTCHPLAEEQLTHGLKDPAARDFLTQTGLPEISDFLHLDIGPRGDSPLVEVAWPGRGRDVPRQRRAKCEAPSSGPFYELGTWMYSRLLLDGTTGRLYRDTTGGSPDPGAGSSLAQFFAMVRLYDEFRRTHFPYVTDHKDAQDNLARWYEQIDPAASRAETWTLILEGYDFEDSTWDLASYGLEWI